MNTTIKKTQIGILLVIIAWLIGSVTLSLLGLLDQPNAPPTFFGLFLAGPPIGFLLAFAFSKKIRDALYALPLWVIVAIHSLRFVGIFFIIDALTHNLPPQFGWPAGVGDIIAAIVSIPLALSLHQKKYSKNFKIRFIAWNIFGLIDLFTAVTLGMLYSVSVIGILSEPDLNTRLLSFFPTSLIPTFYVPMLILLHFLALRRSREIDTSPHEN